MSEQEVQQFYGIYENAGFYFPKSVLTTYCLSLYTKPFVILSGISGTGKTKIAQLFDVPKVETVQESRVTQIPSLSLTVPSSASDRVNFAYEQLPLIFESEDLDEFNSKAAQYRERDDNGNFTHKYLLTIRDEFGEFKIGVYGQRASSPLVRVRFNKSRRDTGEDYDAREHLATHYEIGDVLGLEKIGNRTFKVISVNDEQIVEEVRQFELETINRKCFISVRSDWTDNNDLLGFYNFIEKKYHVPKFLEFLLTTIEHPEHPFFLILDEMNLSKVEHYFSDILSCLESRIELNGQISQEKIILHNGSEALETDLETFENVPSAIEFPTNLYITGTVNIDETTYMFSPKVLDRANVIEFNQVNLEKYGIEDEDDSKYTLDSFPNFTEFLLPSKSDFEQLSQDIKNHLVNINKILEKYNLHFGYRTVNEVSHYINNAQKFIDDTDDVALVALDHQLIQKVFSKLNGAYAKLEPPLREILQYLSSKTDLSEINSLDTPFPRSVDKLQRMHKNLSTSGYASFIE